MEQQLALRRGAKDINFVRHVLTSSLEHGRQIDDKKNLLISTSHFMTLWETSVVDFAGEIWLEQHFRA